MTFSKLLGLVVVMLFVGSCGIQFAPVKVYAHQNGCHRWHSCPSDTGSYVCGDLGYDNYCGNETYYSEPDYTDQGITNGEAQADDDSSVITAQAATDGEAQGREDGGNGDYEQPNPDATATCDKDFTFDGFAPAEYQDAFHDSYAEKCAEIYEDAFNDAYTTGHESGTEEYTLASNETSDDSSTESDYSWVWWTLGIGGVLYAIGKSSRSK